ncbi:MAG: hypothetical protein HKM05_00755 [Spirochaetales bacterium]|nr:hypothetical protein [Spirochaetales bacterium]
MKYFFMGLLFALLAGCTSTAKPVPTTKPITPEKTVSPSPGQFQVSQEKYAASLKEIRQLITKLNRIIQNEDFQQWLTYLDSAYIRAYNDPTRLKALTQNSPVLKGVPIRNLEDYFNFVVVPSRSQAQVDDITFVDQDRVEAWMYIKNVKALLYQLKLYGNQWKISAW